jgi:hypothetical protein
MVTRSILGTVRIHRKFWALAAFPVLLILGSGCGGISASQSISPATFFMPGLMQATPPTVDPLAPALMPDQPIRVANAQ